MMELRNEVRANDDVYSAGGRGDGPRVAEAGPSAELETVPPKRQTASLEADESALTMPRRDFLHLGLMGVAASVTATATAAPAAASEKSADTCPTCCPTTAGGADTGPTSVPAIPKALSPFENWNEPWVFRPADWPGGPLHLNVVENETAGKTVGLGNPGAVLFSYGADTPGPTIRMRGNEKLRVKLRNHLGEDCGTTYIGPFPDEFVLVGDLTLEEAQEASRKLGNERFDFCIGEHVNGVHSVHVTNLHTHGLHVRPDKNPDGTHSDNVILRVISQGDFKRRERENLRQGSLDAEGCNCGDVQYEEPSCDERGLPDPLHAGDFPDGSACAFLRRPEQIYFNTEDEVVGEANYEFRLGNNRVRRPDGTFSAPEDHPPGTHWYHPHAHGATAMQVSSGMAGFLIVEGDVDDAINCYMTGTKSSDPTLKTGPYDYRERLMFMQRIFPGSNRSQDKDSPRSQLNKTPMPAVNGSTPRTIHMKPGAVERWRVLNGSVDGRGYKRFMVLKGNYQIVETAAIPSTDGSQKPVYSLCKVTEVDYVEHVDKDVTIQDIEANKQQLWQLATDGVTLVDASGQYKCKNLAQQNPGAIDPSNDPFQQTPPADILEKIRVLSLPEQKDARKLWHLENVFKDGTNIKNGFIRPNEYYMAPANRTDVFFQCPTEARPGDVYTVLAKGVAIHSDTPTYTLQRRVAGQAQILPESSMVVAHIVVEADEPRRIERRSFDDIMAGVNGCLPRAPEYLQPIADEELRDRRNRKFRTRTITYSGWGNDAYPLVTNHASNPSAAAFQSFIDAHPELEKLTYASCTCNGEDISILMAPAIRTMAINGKKFKYNDPDRPKVLVDTAEQWVLYNTTQTLWAHTDPCEHPQPGQYKGHFIAYPITLGQGADRFWDGDHKLQVVTRGIDHPFHIHQNPFWMSRVEIPDRDGNLHNILDEPRWMDVMWIPRNYGRVVFRSRFPDFVGAYVNHCHLLLHEDNGMMQTVQATPFEAEQNCDFADLAVQPSTDSATLDRMTGRPSNAREALEQAYLQNARFADENMVGQQDFPGFELTVPTWEES